MKNTQQGHLAKLLVVLGTLSIARGCAYKEMDMETPADWVYRHCAVGCIDMKLEDENFVPCCMPLLNGAQAPAVCSDLASAVAAKSTTCVWQAVRTTDSTGYSAPTSYSTAAAPSSVTTTAKPYTSGIEGQAVSYETGSAGTVTEWTTTTIPAPCEPTAAPSTSDAANTNTCECTDYAASSTAEVPSSTAEATSWSSSSAAETSNIEGSAYGSDAASSSPSSSLWSSPTYASDSGVRAGSTPPSGLSGLDRRHEKQYTCACPAATSTSAWSSSAAASSPYVPSETSDVQGQPYSDASSAQTTQYSSSSSTAPSSPAEYTTMTYASDENVRAGNTPPEGEEIVENAKRFLPTIYGPAAGVSGPAVKRLHSSGHVADAHPTKRTYHETTAATNDTSAQQTVTSTITETGSCSATDAQATSSAADGYISSSASVPSTTESDCPTYASDSGVRAGSTPTESVAENAEAHRKRARRKL